jgi:multidrug efflux pump subunit AcrB
MQLSFQDADRIEYSEVASKVLLTSQGERVKLGDLVSMESRPVESSVIRENQRYTMYLNWEYVGTDKMRRNYIQKVIDEMRLPYGYTAEEARQEFFTQEENEELTLMAVLAAAFIFIVMAGLF